MAYTSEAVSTTRIHAATIGAVHLSVPDLDRSVAFYVERLGFAARPGNPGVARLTAAGNDLIVLHADPKSQRVRGTTGLYHLAVLVPTRRDLAQSLGHLLDTGTVLQGVADHGVSEAVYVADPDGIGVEIYRDRPRDEWPSDRNGLRMSTEPLDVDGLLAERRGRAAGGRRLAPGTRIGHVHLRVARLEEAERFYGETLGFERTARYGPEAVFVSAGGYHHHVGLNTWAGVGAPAPPRGSVGLRHFVVTLPDAEERDRVLARVRDAGILVEATSDGPLVRDPSDNGIVLGVGGSAFRH